MSYKFVAINLHHYNFVPPQWTVFLFSFFSPKYGNFDALRANMVVFFDCAYESNHHRKNAQNISNELQKCGFTYKILVAAALCCYSPRGTILSEVHH